MASCKNLPAIRIEAAMRQTQTVVYQFVFYGRSGQINNIHPIPIRCNRHILPAFIYTDFSNSVAIVLLSDYFSGTVIPMNPIAICVSGYSAFAIRQNDWLSDGTGMLLKIDQQITTLNVPDFNTPILSPGNEPASILCVNKS
jgi:hypothetical protein